MKTISQEKLGEFILSCMKTQVACKKIVKEIDAMCIKKCEECGSILTEEESREGVCCDRCYDKLQDEYFDEQKHPDDRG